ncbi:unnamed protein product [Dovyalis caffra]|uniref:Uncharacterized protein n=1 Tax=Dovyalis caffra TaxID=77055 RepID=A0AAV1R6Q3_9ROSI|nr:unnamed protein product [Dovyalis caffra]
MEANNLFIPNDRLHSLNLYPHTVGGAALERAHEAASLHSFSCPPNGFPLGESTRERYHDERGRPLTRIPTASGTHTPEAPRSPGKSLAQRLQLVLQAMDSMGLPISILIGKTVIATRCKVEFLLPETKKGKANCLVDSEYELKAIHSCNEGQVFSNPICSTLNGIDWRTGFEPIEKRLFACNVMLPWVKKGIAVLS